MMKKVIYTCITGGYDNIPQYKYVSRNWDYVLFTDNVNLLKQGKVHHWTVRPLVFNKMDNVRNARWHKVNAHILFPEYDYSLWLDGNISIEQKTVFDNVKNFIKQNTIVAVPIHMRRNCIYKEAEIIIERSIDYKSVVNREVRYLRKRKYPENNGLHETCILLRKHNAICDALDQWWDMIKTYSKRDQLSFDYVMWANNIKIIPFYNDAGTGTHRYCDNFLFTYQPQHDQAKIKQRQFKLFEKKHLPSGRVHINICGIKFLSYHIKRKIPLANIYEKQIVKLLHNRFLQYTGKHPSDKLITLNDKIIWAQMFNATELKTKLADKYTVRDYVAGKIGYKYLTKLYGVWDNVNDIDFTSLPNKYVLKFSEGSGKVLLVPNKNKLNIENTKQQIINWQNNPFWVTFCEMQYKNSAKKIIAEEFIDTKIEYKLWIFHGKCKFIKIEIMNEFAENGKPDNQFGKFFYPDWTPADFRTIGDEPNFDIQKPEKLSELIQISEILAKPFDFVRVDFFETDKGKLVFGEMTFSPAAGNIHFDPASKDTEFGKLWTLPSRNKNGFGMQ